MNRRGTISCDLSFLCHSGIPLMGMSGIPLRYSANCHFELYILIHFEIWNNMRYFVPSPRWERARVRGTRCILYQGILTRMTKCEFYFRREDLCNISGFKVF